MKIKEIFNEVSDGAQNRVEVGSSFEKWFDSTFEVKKVPFHLSRGNINVRFKSNPAKFPSMAAYKRMSPSELHITDDRGEAFEIFKADFVNDSENLLKKEGGEKEIDGNEPGNFFELKTGALSFKRKLMFAEFKKVATKKDFITKFGSSEDLKNWDSLTKKEQTSQWNSYLSKIRLEFSEQIKNYNEIIDYIKNELNRIKPNVEGSIRRRIKNILKGKGWFLVKGKPGSASFYKIDVDTFIENLTYQTTQWSKITRIKADIRPTDAIETAAFKENNNIKNDIIHINEFLDTDSKVKINTSSEFEDGGKIEFSFNIEVELESVDIPLDSLIQ